MAQATSAAGVRPAAISRIPSVAAHRLDPIQLHAEAHNALVMALHYVRQPEANIPGAARKAVQALAALRRIDAAIEAVTLRQAADGSPKGPVLSREQIGGAA